VNKTVGIGIGIAVVAIAAVFAFSYSVPENQTPEESVAIQDEATANVQVGVTEPGKKISIEVEENLGVEVKAP